MNNNEIKRRLKFIIVDANRLLSHLERGGDMNEFTDYADNGYTHLSNIQIAADLNDNESGAWQVEDLRYADRIIARLNAMEVDGETMQYIIDKAGMSHQMLRQLVMSASDLELNQLIEEKQTL